MMSRHCQGQRHGARTLNIAELVHSLTSQVQFAHESLEERQVAPRLAPCSVVELLSICLLTFLAIGSNSTAAGNMYSERSSAQQRAGAAQQQRHASRGNQPEQERVRESERELLRGLFFLMKRSVRCCCCLFCQLLLICFSVLTHLFLRFFCRKY